jgi:dUTPase
VNELILSKKIKKKKKIKNNKKITVPAGTHFYLKPVHYVNWKSTLGLRNGLIPQKAIGCIHHIKTYKSQNQARL